MAYSQHRAASADPLRLQIEGLYPKLKSPFLQYLPTPCTNHSTNDAIHLHSATAMSSTTPDIFPVSASDIAHTLDRALDGQICTDQHPIHALIVSAIQRAWISNPHGLCSYTWCGVKHDPLCCCICFGSNHKTIDCWHFNGLCDNRKELFIKAVQIITF